MGRNEQLEHLRPNAGHDALVHLERQGRLHAVLTQNVDGLHQAAGSSPGRVVELHGAAREVACLACGDRTTIRSALDRVLAGEPDPVCLRCGGLLKSATIYFGQVLEEAVVDAAVAAVEECDVLLAVGTSLQVHPAAGLVDVAAARGTRIVVVNAESTPYDGVADLVVREPIGAALSQLVGAPATQ